MHNRRLCCLFFWSTLFLGIIIYGAISFLMNLHLKVGLLETDVSDLYSITKKPIDQSCGRHTDLCSEENLRKEIQKYTFDLQNELVQTKQLVKLLESQKQDAVGENMHFIVEKPDYAPEKLGGKIVQVEGELFAADDFVSTFLIHYMFGKNKVIDEAKKILDPVVEPGSCFGFKGQNATVTIKLFKEIYIESVTVYHITHEQSPDYNLKSAPKEFSVYGKKSLENAIEFYFGTFTYNVELRMPAQNFIITNISAEKYQFVKFDFKSNHGNKNYTCVYRVSVHGRQ